MSGVSGPGTASFRDPAGTLISDPASTKPYLLRAVHPAYVDGIRTLLSSSFLRELMEEGTVVETRETADPARALEDHGLGAPTGTPTDSPADSAPEWIRRALVLEHERVPFPSYPEEWPPEMLHAAGALTLEICRRALEEGYILKDATPRNVLFRGSDPVFVDLPSFEEPAEGDPVWRAHAQFVETFLLPLMASRDLGLPMAAHFAGPGEGIEPVRMARMLPLRKLLRPATLGLVTLPALLTPSGHRLRAQGRKGPRFDREVAREVLLRHIRKLEKRLERLRPSVGGGPSRWEGYQDACHYPEEAWAAKLEAVERVAARLSPATALDLGCNEGEFSAVVARAGASVVAVDADEGVVGRTWRRARDGGLEILPLVVDLADPTPPAGWRNRERPSFLRRSRGRFDGILALAVVHHLLVTHRVPLDEILALIRELARDFALVEYVPPDDPRFRALAWGREELFQDLTLEAFLEALGRTGTVEETIELPGSQRRLVLVRYG